MKITNNAKAAFQGEMTKQNFDSVRMFVEDSDQGQVLKLEMQNNEDNARSIEINGLNVIIDEALEMQLEPIKFDYDGASLVMTDESIDFGGCNGGCSSCGSGC
jgi:Fe-S cluster assembly iron-binding protein IscA